MEQSEGKRAIELKQNAVATRILWISVFLGVICNYFGGSPINVIVVLLTLGLCVAVLFTFISVKKIMVSWTKYIALFGLIFHALLITLVHHSLNNIFLLFFNLIFISLFLKVSLIIITYIANLIMVFAFYIAYGDKMYVGYANIQGMLIILFYMFLACVILFEMVRLITNLQQTTQKQFYEAQENRNILKTVLDKMTESIRFLKNFSVQVTKDMTNAVDTSEEMSESFNEVASSAEEQYSITESIHDYMNMNSNHIMTIVDDTNELKQIVVSNSQLIESGNKTLQGMMQQYGHLTSIFDETAELIEEFNNQNKNIDEILTSIDAIAQQTNLLSLNANIEAARAGEHGRGFTVVADEIRKLADSSAHSVNMIGRILQTLMDKSNEMQNKINVGQELMQKNRKDNINPMKVFQEIINFNEVVLKNTDNVHKKIEELNSNSSIVVSQTKDITDSTGNISNAINSIVQSADLQNQLLQNISKSFNELENLIHQLNYMTKEIV